MVDSVNHQPQRRRIRLPADLYQQIGTTAFLTITSRDRQPVFENRQLASSCIDTLRQQATFDGIDIIAYCLMPDHIHILARIESDVSITRFVQQFKGRTTRNSWSHGVTGTLWQRSFYDHLLRENERIESYIQYVVENPVKRGMVDVWWDYPFTGSFIFDLENDDWW